MRQQLCLVPEGTLSPPSFSGESGHSCGPQRILVRINELIHVEEKMILTLAKMVRKTYSRLLGQGFHNREGRDQAQLGEPQG